MKKLLLIIPFVSGCINYASIGGSGPWARGNNVTCDGNVCCYTTDNKVLVCVSSEPANKNVIIYFKVIEK